MLQNERKYIRKNYVFDEKTQKILNEWKLFLEEERGEGISEAQALREAIRRIYKLIS